MSRPKCPQTRDDHGAGEPEWTLAGVCIFGWSSSQRQYFRFEPEPESPLRSAQEPINFLRDLISVMMLVVKQNGIN